MGGFGERGRRGGLDGKERTGFGAKRVVVGNVFAGERFAMGLMGERRERCRIERRMQAYIYAFVGEAGRDGRGFFFGFREEYGEFFDGGHGDVAAVVAGEEGLGEACCQHHECHK